MRTARESPGPVRRLKSLTSRCSQHPGCPWHLQDQDRLIGWLIRLRITRAKPLLRTPTPPTKPTGHISAVGAAAKAQIPCPLHQNCWGSISPTAPHQTMGPLPCRLARSSGVSLASPGITSNAALPSIARIATSPPFWQGSNANTRARRFTLSFGLRICATALSSAG